jgi:hypothetical protein
MHLLSFVLAAAVSTSALAADTGEKPRLHNSATAFTAFWDANKDKPAIEQVAAFKDQVAPVFPGFYTTARFKGEFTQAQYDARIEGAIKEFPTIRASYVKKAQEFGSELPKYIATFKVAFPDLQLPEDIYVLHSLGEMDGGFRNIDGKSQFIFGVDAMAKFHGNGNESAFFHHELFHLYHSQVMTGCGDAGIWRSLWAEGLAVHVAKVLNPEANEQELSLDIPDGMAAQTRAMLPEALDQLESVLDSTDDKAYAGLFFRRGEAGKLPKRRGYYLGYLVAQQAGKTREIRELAKLNCGQVKELIFSTVHKLRADHALNSL